MDKKELSYDKIAELLEKEDENKNKRKIKNDWVSKTATILSLCAWTIMLAVWTVLHLASGDRYIAMTASFGRWVFDMEPNLRFGWDRTLVYVAFVLLLVSLATCVIAFLFNKRRMKRKTDKYKKSIFVIGGITIIALVFFLIDFWSMLF